MAQEAGMNFANTKVSPVCFVQAFMLRARRTGLETTLLLTQIKPVRVRVGISIAKGLQTRQQFTIQSLPSK
jgi:hypothetical protein